MTTRFNVSLIRKGMLVGVVPSTLTMLDDLYIKDVSYANGFDEEPTGGEVVPLSSLNQYSELLSILEKGAGDVQVKGLGNWNTYDPA